MGFSITGSTVTQTGGSTSARDTPQGIIDIGGGTLIAPDVIRVSADVEIEGFYDDTGWTYVFDFGFQIRGVASTTDWVSGSLSEGVNYDGAIFIFNASFPTGKNDFAGGGAKLVWRDVYLGGTQVSSDLRIDITDLDSDSILDIKVVAVNYIAIGWGPIVSADIRYLNCRFLRFGGTNPSTVSSLIHLSYADAVLLNSVYDGVITFTKYEPKGPIAGVLHFHSVGADRRYVHIDPLFDVADIKIYNKGEVVQVHQNIDFKFEAEPGAAISGIVLRAFSGNYNFPVSTTTDINGEATLFLENVWEGSGNTVASYETPTTIVDYSVFSVCAISYKNQIEIFPRAAGNGRIVINALAKKDSLIAQSDEVVVGAYNSIENAGKGYDRDRFDLVAAGVPVSQTYSTKNEGSWDFRSADVVMVDGANVDPIQRTLVDRILVSVIVYTGVAYNGSVQTTGSLTIGTLAENGIVKNASSVAIASKPGVMTVDNTILDLAPGDDITGFVEINGGSYRATADGTYIARGKSAGIIDANGFTIEVDTAVTAQVTPQYDSVATYAVYPTEADAFNQTNAIATGLAQGSAYTYSLNTNGGTLYFRRSDFSGPFAYDTSQTGDSNVLPMYVGNEVAVNQQPIIDQMGTMLEPDGNKSRFTLASLVNAPDSVADIIPVLTALAALNDVSAADVRAAFDAAEFKDKNTEAEIHAWLDSYPGGIRSLEAADQQLLNEIRALLSALNSKSIQSPCHHG